MSATSTTAEQPVPQLPSFDEILAVFWRAALHLRVIEGGGGDG